jgi:carboxyl-terminal processing protease
MFIALCLLLGWSGTATRAQEASLNTVTDSAPSRDLRLKVFDQVWRSINENYYDRNFHGIDWITQRNTFRPLAEQATSNAEFYRALRAMIGKLGDAHTRIYSPDDGFDRYRPAGTTVGLTVRRVESRAVITNVDANSEAAAKGIRPGMAVTQVDGVTIDRVLRKLQEEVGPSSTPTARDLQSLDRLFYGPRDTTLTLTLVNNAGAELSYSLTRRYVEFQRRVTSRLLPSNIGYIEISGFGPEIERDFEAALQRLRETRGMILDLRNNGGGFVSTVTQIASYFFSEETDLGEFVTRQGRATRRKTLRVRETYRAPLVILVSSRSASGAEILAAAVQERKRGQVIGTNQTTCGCLLGVSRTLRLDDGGKLNVSDTDFRTWQGRRIEGFGVQPDQRVDLLISDLLIGRDTTLETAVDQLHLRFLFGNQPTPEFKLFLPTFEAPALTRPLPASQDNR